MQVLKFYDVKPNSTSDLAALDNSILIPTEDSLLCSEDDSLETLPALPMHKSKSVNITSMIDNDYDHLEILQAKLAINDEPMLFKMRMRIRLMEAFKPQFLFHFIKRTNLRLNYIETTPSKKNITGEGLILRGFEGNKVNKYWCYIQYGENEMRCTLKYEKCKSKHLHFNAQNSPFVAINFYNVTSYNGMFTGMNELKDVVIEKWDTSAITSMEEMFSQCSSLESIRFFDCDFSAVKSMVNLCAHCVSLKELHFIKCKMNIACDYWRMLHDCPGTVSVKFPDEIYDPVMRANREYKRIIFTRKDIK